MPASVWEPVRRCWLVATLLILGIALFAAPAAARSALGANKVEPLAPLDPAVRDGALLTLEGRPVLLLPDRALILREGATRWTPLPARIATRAARLTVVPSGQAAALFDAAAPRVERIELAALADGRLTGRALAPLPTPLAGVRATWEGAALLIAGFGADGRARLFRLDPAGTRGWTAEPAWPGDGALQSASAQNRARILVMADGRVWRWHAQTGWRAGTQAPGAIVPGSGTPVGQAHLLYAVEGAGRGAGTTLYSLSSITGGWAALGRLPTDRLVGAVKLNDGLLVAARGADGLRLWTVTTDFARKGLAPIDMAIIAVYMFAMLGMGLYFYLGTSRASSTEFFLGNRRIPFWAAGLSMFAGTIGSVNYLAYPAKSFETDWQYLMSKLTYVGALVIVAIWLAPFFRRLNLVSVYSYLEARFHLGIRLLASGLWIVLQLGARMGIILYLPALAINSMTGVDIVACILAVGLFTIVYTALGGMRAVVWTDVVQVFILIGGALFAIGFILYSVGVGEVVETTRAFDKTHAINLSFDVKQPTIWTFLVLAVLEGILCFPRDQIVMQRVLATSTPKEASWSILTFAAILLPSAFLFYGIGTALFAFYRAHPGDLDPMLPIDAVFPTFIGTQLPNGVIGLVIAGVLAAAMGVLSGIINSVATLLSVDFYERFMPRRTQRQIVRFSEVVSVLVGLIGIAIAILLSRLNVHSLLDLTIELGGVFGGSFAGAYPLGMFSTRANWQGAAIGIVVSAVLTLAAWALGLFHPYLYLAFAIALSMGVGYLASLAFPPPARSLDGLTVFGPRARPADA